MIVMNSEKNYFLIIQKNSIKMYFLTFIELNQSCSERSHFFVRNGFEADY